MDKIFFSLYYFRDIHQIFFMFISMMRLVNSNWIFFTPLHSGFVEANKFFGFAAPIELYYYDYAYVKMKSLLAYKPFYPLFFSIISKRIEKWIHNNKNKIKIKFHLNLLWRLSSSSFSISVIFMLRLIRYLSLVFYSLVNNFLQVIIFTNFKC